MSAAKLRRIVKKLLYLLITVFFILVFNYVLFRLLPGSYLTNLSHTSHASETQLTYLKQYYGLTGTWLEQFTAYLKNLARFDLGTSYAYNQPVWTVIRARILPTVLLLGVSELVAIVVGMRRFGPFRLSKMSVRRTLPFLMILHGCVPGKSGETARGRCPGGLQTFSLAMTARTKPTNRGWGLFGRLLNSGWYCTATKKECSGSSTVSTIRPSGEVPPMRSPCSSMAAGRRVKEEGADNDLLSRIAADPAFGLTQEQLNGILRPRDYVGRAPEQTAEYAAWVRENVLEPNRALLNETAELNV